MKSMGNAFIESLNSLRSKPEFVSTVVVTMGVTLGALLCVLTLGYLLIVKPLPYPDQQRLFVVQHNAKDNTGATKMNAFTYPSLIRIYKLQDVFDSAALSFNSQSVLHSLASQPKLSVGYVTPEWFDITDAKIALGRVFENSEGLDKHIPVAVLSYDAWQEHFNADSEIIGEQVQVQGKSFKIVGVTSENYFQPELTGIGQKTHIWLPFDFAAIPVKDCWGCFDPNLILVGKTKLDLNSVQAEQLLTTVIADEWKSNVSRWDVFDTWHLEMKLLNFKDVILGESQRAVYLLIISVLGLVLIAFANISNLYMSRTAEKQHILAIHAAVGASPFNIFNILLMESLVLMGLSILLALPVSLVGFELVGHFLQGILPRIDELSLGMVTFTLAVFLVLLFSVSFSFVSMKSLNLKALNLSLQSSGKGNAFQVSKKIRYLLSVTQVAVTTALVFISLNIYQSAMKEINAPMHFSTENLLSVSYASPFSPQENGQLITSTMEQLRSELESLPSVEMVSRSPSPFYEFEVWGLNDDQSGEKFNVNVKRIDKEYFHQIDQKMIEGDYFSAEEIRSNSAVIIVNESFARKLSANSSVIGLTLTSAGGTNFVVKGIVESINIPDSDASTIRAYIPHFATTHNFLISLKGGQSLTREQVVTVAQQIDGRISLFSFEYLDLSRKKLFLSQIATTITTIVVSVISLALAAAGLYGVIGYSLKMQKVQLGTRMAIGASPMEILLMVLKENLLISVVGIVAGLCLTIGGLSYFAEHLQGYLMAGGILSLFITLCLVVFIVVIACYLPIRQYIYSPVVNSLREQ